MKRVINVTFETVIRTGLISPLAYDKFEYFVELPEAL